MVKRHVNAWALLILFVGIPVPLIQIGECPTQFIYTLHHGTSADKNITMFIQSPDCLCVSRYIILFIADKKYTAEKPFLSG